MYAMVWALPAMLAIAQDDMDALYEPAPPANSAFVRVVNTGPIEQSLVLSGRDRGAVEPGAVTPYFVATAGEHVVRLGDATSTLSVEAQGYYTVAPNDDALVVVADEGKLDLAKATLVLYNFSALDAVDLKTADGSAAVIQGVGPGERAQRKVNGITVDLAVFAGDEQLAELPQRQLERNAGYAVVVTPDEEGARVTWARATTKAR